MEGFWKDTKHRVRRLWASIISKKWLAFFMATALLWSGKIDGSIWVIALGVAVGASSLEKIKGVLPDLPKG